ncbi:MAG: hypothetical protein ACOH2E_04585 [Candidatus Paracaedibacter sp.]
MQKMRNKILKLWLIAFFFHALVGVETLAMDTPMDQDPTNNRSSYKRPHDSGECGGEGKKRGVEQDLPLEASVENEDLNLITAPLSIELEPQEANMMMADEKPYLLESIISENDSNYQPVHAANEPFSIESLAPHHSDIIFNYVLKYANHPTFFKLLYTSPWMHQSICKVIASAEMSKEIF